MTTTNDLLAEGLTTRQIEYWINAKYLRVGNPGSGTNRDWPYEEVLVARLMYALTKAGMTAKAAAAAARSVAHLPAGERRCQLSPGVWIEVSA